MTSDQLGLTDEFYDLQVPLRRAHHPDREFIHGAPWAASRIGAWNGSTAAPTSTSVPRSGSSTM